MKAFRLTEPQWLDVRKEIDRQYPPSVSMVRWKMKQVLGFTPREHEEWVVIDHTGDRERRMLKKEIHIDFYSEQHRTMFLLKYGHLFQESKSS